MKRENQGSLRLYVWESVLADYSEGVMFSLAHDIDEARSLMAKKIPDWDVRGLRDLRQDPIIYNSPMAFMLYGGE